MDPNETLKWLLDAATTQTSDEAHAHRVANEVLAAAADLADWIRGGGFAPNDPRGGAA